MPPYLSRLDRGASEVEQGGGGGGGRLFYSQVKQYDAGGNYKRKQNEVGRKRHHEAMGRATPILIIIYFYNLFLGHTKSVCRMSEASCRMATVTPLSKYTHVHAFMKTGVNS
jgi:hypothetical protein